MLLRRGQDLHLPLDGRYGMLEQKLLKSKPPLPDNDMLPTS